LRAIVNVEGNFYPNLDYGHCFAAGIAVLTISPAFAVPVAELAIGLALDLARGITAADRAVREGTELYGSRGNSGARLLSRSRVGLVGYGAIGRAIRKLLRAFSAEVSVYDPWLPDNAIREDDCRPLQLRPLLAESDLIVVSAAATSENQHLLGRAELKTIRPDGMLVIVSRAAVVDFDALVELADAGRFRAATDVFPVEPIPAGDRLRSSRLLLSPHRGGGMRAAMAAAAEMILDDLGLILRGLPPVRLAPARRETVELVRSKPSGPYMTISNRSS
jgi:phosphoglycerate dehydrogenase-like enzyme